MADHINETVSGQVVLDGKVFENVTFSKAQLSYEGGTPPRFINCAFQDATFSFHEYAANTVNFLKAMAGENTGMRFIVDGLLPELKA